MVVVERGGRSTARSSRLGPRLPKIKRLIQVKKADPDQFLAA
jgi:hypothetical protein